MTYQIPVIHGVESRRVTPSRAHRSWTIHGALLLLFSLVPASAQEAFTPPQAYPAERYEAGWNKNPFTLKTAPVAVQQESFAKDLVFASYYGSSQNPTVVVANKVTQERTVLRMGQPAANGMTLKSAVIKPSRKDCYAEITLGGETATVRYDNSFISQMASKSAPVPPLPALTGQANAPAQPGGVPMTNAAPVKQAPGGMPLPTTAGAGYPGSRPAAPTPGAPAAYGAAAQPSSVASALNAAGNVPTPVRRRLLTAPVPQPAAQPQSVR